MIKNQTKDLEYIGPSLVHLRSKPTKSDELYTDHAKECFYSLLGTEYIPDDVARRMTQTYAEAKGGMPVTIQTVVYKGNCYMLMHADDIYRLCRQLVTDYFPDDRCRQLMIRAYTLLIEECVTYET